MKNLLINYFGEKWYCRMFHTSYGTNDNKWYCPKCKITRDKRLGDDDLGPP